MHYYKNFDKYDENQCYKLAQKIIKTLKRNARIKTVSYGNQYLPKDGGYIMYSNHQGKYDALGIMSVHEKPCSIVMDAERSRVILTSQFIDLVRGIRLERCNYKQQLQSIQRIAKDAVQGKRYIYFPEGKYDRNGNHLQDFRAGSFKCAKMSKCPIVPVAIYDSHLPFDFNSFRKVITQVYFLEPIYFEEYEEMSTKEISIMVRERIEMKLEYLQDKKQKLGYNLKFIEKEKNVCNL